MKLCAICNKEWTGRGTKCNTCKTRLRRSAEPTPAIEVNLPSNEPTLEPSSEPTPKLGIHTFYCDPKTLTKTDGNFIEHGNRIGYRYIFDKELRKDLNCNTCREKFSTHLLLSRFCSRECM